MRREAEQAALRALIASLEEPLGYDTDCFAGMIGLSVLRAQLCRDAAEPAPSAAPEAERLAS